MEDSDKKKPSTNRPYIGIRFDCCSVYQRIYREPDEQIYAGRCPKCLKMVRVEVDPQNGKAVKFLRAE